MKNVVVLFTVLFFNILLFSEENTENINDIKIWKSDSKKIVPILAEIRKYKINDKDTEIQIEYKKNKQKEISKSLNKSYVGKTLSLKRAHIVDITEVKEKNEKHMRISMSVLNNYYTKTRKKIATDNDIEIIVKKIYKNKILKGYKLVDIDDINKKNTPFLTKKEIYILKELYGLSHDSTVDLFFLLVKINTETESCEDCYDFTGAYNIQMDIPFPNGYGSYNYGLYLNSNESSFDKYNTLDIVINYVTKDKDYAMNLSKDDIIYLNCKIVSIEYTNSNAYHEKVTLYVK
ncbi:MAG TPA: hypothetical protein P5123_09075 [Spirochaetota bacterium]|nr:hypothetical protein [Spirochaetota bacterium]